MSDFFKVARTGEVLSALSWVEPRVEEMVPLADCLGRVLAADVTAEVDIPHFDRAVMDGYAVRASDTFGCSEAQPAYLGCRFTVEMGKPAEKFLQPGEAARISTGGMMPPGADAVVMWEYTREDDGLVEVFRPVAPGENRVGAGEDVRCGETTLKAGDLLGPPEVGLLAGLGRTSLAVRQRPRVAVVSTGDELVDPGEKPGPGRIRNINQSSLGAWLQWCGAEPVLLGVVPDDYERIVEGVDQGLGDADMVLISGGSSAGVRDLTRRAVEAFGDPGLLFHGLAIRPGKPTVVGASRQKPIFGLPGHPVSAMVIFLVLVRPVVNRLLGRPDESGLLRVPARLNDNLPSQAGREDYYQVRIGRSGGALEASPIFRKSGLVSAMVHGAGMVRVPPEKEGLEAGELVDVEVYGA